MPSVTVNGAELHYEEVGEGPPIVFIHGVWMSGRVFERQLKYFGERYRAVALDLRGHGRSEHVHEGHTVAQYARDLRSVLETLGLGNAVAVGWSMGALVIWEYVKQLGTDGLRGIVVVDQTTSDYQWPDWPYGLFDFDGLRHVMAGAQTDRQSLIEGFIPLLFKEPPSEEHSALIVGEALRPPATIASTIIFDQTVQDYRPVLPEIDVPVLVCTGADERAVPIEAERYIVDHTPNARLVVFEESGHCPFLEEPDRFNEEVDAFVRSLA